MSEEKENIAQTIARFVNEGTVQTVVGDESVVAVPNHWKTVDLEQYMVAPRRIQVQRRLTTLQGFADYVAAHAFDGCTAIYVERASVLAIIDEIEPGKNEPAWRDHQATLPIEYTPEWEAWHGASGLFIPQRKFVDFIQDRAGEIAEPAMADLVTQLQAVNAESTGSRRDVSAHLSEEHKRQAATRITNELPEFLELTLPMITCEPEQMTSIRARLTAKLNDDGVTFAATLVNAPIVVDRRIRELVGRLKEKIGKKAAVYF